jgi:hypothetical protein
VPFLAMNGAANGVPPEGAQRPQLHPNAKARDVEETAIGAQAGRSPADASLPAYLVS